MALRNIVLDGVPIHLQQGGGVGDIFARCSVKDGWRESNAAITKLLGDVVLLSVVDTQMGRRPR